jgi:urease accessory protein
MRKLCCAILLVLPALAQAHPGHATDGGMLAGLLHPFSGADHLLAIALAGILMRWLRGPIRWMVCSVFLGSLGIAHVMWTAPANDAGYVAGLLAATASLIAAGMAATRLVEVIAAAGRSRTSAEAVSPRSSPSARR